MRKQGFTVIEIIIVAVFLIIAGVVLFFQIQRVEAEHADAQKKTAINAIHYSLEEYFYPKHEYYPEHIEEGTLPTMDNELLTDPDGAAIGTPESAYRYEPKQCSDGKCASYSLRALLENEDDFVKSSNND